MAIDNDGPATTLEIVLDPTKGRTRRFTYELAANETHVDAWSIEGGDLPYTVSVTAGDRHATATEEFCSSRAFLVFINQTAITFEHQRGDGFFGC